MNMNQSFSLWQLFFRIVERGSLSKAAADMRIDPSVASRRIAALEQSLHVQLLNRSTRKMSLTPAGKTAYEQMRPLLGEMDAVLSDLSRQSLEGKIRITAPVNFGERHVTSWLALFQRHHPGVSLDFVLSDHCLDLRAEGIDLAIRVGNLPDSGLVAHKLGWMPNVLCASPGYLAEHGTPEAIDDLASHSFIIYSGMGKNGGTTLELTQDGRREVLDLSGSFSINNAGAILRAVLDGAGLHAGPAWLFADPLSRAEVVRVLPDWQLSGLPVHILRLNSRYIPLRVSALIEWLQRCWRESSLGAAREGD